MAWQEKIGGCFGQGDFKFAGHQGETERAIDLLTTALNERIGYAEYIQGIKSWLEHKNLLPKEIEKELEKVKDLSSYFFFD